MSNLLGLVTAARSKPSYSLLQSTAVVKPKRQVGEPSLLNGNLGFSNSIPVGLMLLTSLLERKANAQESNLATAAATMHKHVPTCPSIQGAENQQSKQDYDLKSLLLKYVRRLAGPYIAKGPLQRLLVYTYQIFLDTPKSSALDI